MIHLPTESRGAQRALVRFFSVACERTSLATFEGEPLVGASFGPAWGVLASLTTAMLVSFAAPRFGFGVTPRTREH
jgi:hypothetical protein